MLSTTTRTLLRNVFRSCRMTLRGFAYEGDGKTTVSVLNKDRDDVLLVDSYSTIGFRLNNGLYVIGPMAIFPRSVLQWNVGSLEDVPEEAFSLFTLLEPKVDVLVIGMGDRHERINPRLVKFLRSKGIGLEAHPTVTACTTFNFLNVEDRNVAAALIPPTSVTTGDEIYLQHDRVRRSLLTGE